MSGPAPLDVSLTLTRRRLALASGAALVTAYGGHHPARLSRKSW